MDISLCPTIFIMHILFFSHLFLSIYVYAKFKHLLELSNYRKLFWYLQKFLQHTLREGASWWLQVICQHICMSVRKMWQKGDGRTRDVSEWGKRLVMEMLTNRKDPAIAVWHPSLAYFTVYPFRLTCLRPLQLFFSFSVSPCRAVSMTIHLAPTGLR